LSIH